MQNKLDFKVEVERELQLISSQNPWDLYSSFSFIPFPPDVSKLRMIFFEIFLTEMIFYFLRNVSNGQENYINRRIFKFWKLFCCLLQKMWKYQLHSSKPNVSISAYQLTLLMQTQRFIFYKNVIKIQTVSPFVIQFNGIAIKNCDKCWRFFPSPK